MVGWGLEPLGHLGREDGFECPLPREALCRHQWLWQAQQLVSGHEHWHELLLPRHGRIPGNWRYEKTLLGRVRVKCAQSEGDGKATEKPRKSQNPVFQGDESGVSKGGFLQGGQISIIGVVCALVAIDFAWCPCKNLWVYCVIVYIGFNKQPPHNKKIILTFTTGAGARVRTVRHDPNYEIYWVLLPAPKPPLEMGEVVYLQLELFCLQLSFSAYSCFCLASVLTALFGTPQMTRKSHEKVTSKNSRAAKRWGFKPGGFPDQGLVLPFLSFFVLIGTFLIFPGFSRFARGWSGDFPDSSLFSFSAYQEHLRGTVPKGSATQSGPFPEKSGKPSGLETHPV